jgi:hypothetical protein
VQTWTLAPFASPGSQAQAVSFAWEDDMVYFAETSQAQLAHGGKGMGTFDLNATAAAGLRRRDETVLPGTGKANHMQDAKLGNVLRCAMVSVSNACAAADSIARYPKWGIRIHCEKLPNIQQNL